MSHTCWCNKGFANINSALHSPGEILHTNTWLFARNNKVLFVSLLQTASTYYEHPSVPNVQCDDFCYYVTLEWVTGRRHIQLCSWLSFATEAAQLIGRRVTHPKLLLLDFFPCWCSCYYDDDVCALIMPFIEEGGKKKGIDAMPCHFIMNA